MTLLGWISFIVFSIATLFFLFQLIRDILWNNKLRKFQKNLGVTVKPVRSIFWIKRSYGAVVASLFVVATVFSGTFNLPEILNERVLVNAKSIENQSQLRSLFSNQRQNFPIYSEVDFDLVESIPSNEDRDFIGTNNQIESVEEADIIKTDGKTIYYASRYENHIRIVTIGNQGVATLEEELHLNDFYTDSLFLTDDYLIAIGYTYENSPYYYNSANDTIGWRFPSYTGTVLIYDKNTLELVYSLKTDTNYYQYRLIDHALYLISNKNAFSDELRPEFRTLIDGIETKSYLDYQDIYYFDDTPVYGMTVFTGINLKTFEINSQAFLGYVNQIYANEENLYTTFSYYKQSNFINAIIGSYTETQILKFQMDTENASLNYVAEGKVSGRIDNQYWMDEYNGYLRVVTTDNNPVINRLFVLQEELDTDDLVVVGSIKNGLGKPNESVYSVDFEANIAYVVTYEKIDPRYQIDLSNPKNPTITSAEERPGYSTYIHIWNKPSETVHIGFQTDANQRVIGMEISAFDDDLKREDSYLLPYKDEFDQWTFSYSEAIYNPKALMISRTHGIFAFPVISYQYTETESNQYEYKYVSQYLVFFIDFTKENDEDIISDPIVISQMESEYYMPIDRGIYISETGDQAFRNIYTFSSAGIMVYSLLSNSVVQTIPFELPEWAK